MTATGFFNAKCFSSIICVPFCLVFKSFINVSNISLCLMKLKSRQYELSKAIDMFLC